MYAFQLPIRPLKKKIPAEVLLMASTSSLSKRVNKVLAGVFSCDHLAAHTLTGGNNRPGLDPMIVREIIGNNFIVNLSILVSMHVSFLAENKMFNLRNSINFNFGIVHKIIYRMEILLITKYLFI